MRVQVYFDVVDENVNRASLNENETKTERNRTEKKSELLTETEGLPMAGASRRVSPLG